MNSFGQTDKGYARVMNQDCYLIDEKNNAILAVVCDGIGGHQAGGEDRRHGVTDVSVTNHRTVGFS